MIVVTYLLRQSITLYKNLGGLEQNLGGLEPLSPIASAATDVRHFMEYSGGDFVCQRCGGCARDCLFPPIVLVYFDSLLHSELRKKLHSVKSRFRVDQSHARSSKLVPIESPYAISC